MAHIATAGPARDPNGNAIVTVRWALILTCAYLMLMGRGGADEVPAWLGPLLIAAYLASNLIVGRARQPYSQGLKVGLAVLDSCFIAASLWVAGQLSVELLLLCLGVLVLAIAGLSVGTIATVTIGLSIASLGVGWVTGGSAPLLQSSLLLRVPFLLGAAMVFALLVDRGRSDAPVDRDDLLESINAHVGQQNDAIRRCNAALADGAVKSAHAAMEDVVFHNRQMAQKLGRFRPEGARHAA
jgi:hypothetical protein